MLAMILKATVAFAIAAFIAWTELVTSKYPRTIKLFWKSSWALWTYPVIYGLISLGFTLAYVPLARSGVLRLDTSAVTEAPSKGTSDTTAKAGSEREAERRDRRNEDGRRSEERSQGKDTVGTDETTNRGVDAPTLLTAIMLGLSAKALLHIRFFSVPTTGTQQTFPVGTETFVQLFEPWLLRTIAIDEFNAVSAYLLGKAQSHSDLNMVKATIKANLPGPNAFPDPERTALILDVDQAGSVGSALEIYLRAFGVSTLNRVFP
jgi:hypothetical protein